MLQRGSSVFLCRKFTRVSSKVQYSIFNTTLQISIFLKLNLIGDELKKTVEEKKLRNFNSFPTAYHLHRSDLRLRKHLKKYFLRDISMTVFFKNKKITVMNLKKVTR